MDIHSEAFDATFDRRPSAWQCDDGDNDFLNDRQLHPPSATRGERIRPKEGGGSAADWITRPPSLVLLNATAHQTNSNSHSTWLDLSIRPFIFIDGHDARDGDIITMASLNTSEGANQIN